MITRIVLISLAAAFFAGCGGGDEPTETPVVAAFYPLAFAAERVGGDEVAVRNLTPAGAEPHDYELSSRDVEAVRSADLIVYLGSGFQPAVEEAVDGAEGRRIDVLEGLRLLPGADDGELQFDPHVWLDPIRFERIVNRIAAALERPGAAAALTRELRELDREYRDGLRDCPRRELVTSHAAFGYLAGRYGLEQISIAGLSPEAEPTARELEQLVEEVRSSGATTVFFETLVSSRLARTIARETGAATAALNPIEGLSEDELARGENYLSLMRTNLGTLREALGCR